MRISDWSSDVCSSDLEKGQELAAEAAPTAAVVAGSASGSWFGPAPGCRAQSGHSIPRVATPGGNRTAIVPPRRRHPLATIALLPRTVRMSSPNHPRAKSILDRDQRVAYIPSGSKPRTDWRHGTTHETSGSSPTYPHAPDHGTD